MQQRSEAHSAVVFRYMKGAVSLAKKIAFENTLYLRIKLIKRERRPHPSHRIKNNEKLKFTCGTTPSPVGEGVEAE